MDSERAKWVRSDWGAVRRFFRGHRRQSSRSCRKGFGPWLQAHYPARSCGAVAIASGAVDPRRAADYMIQPLRRSHFWIWIVLSVLLSVLFTAGLIVRRPTTPKNPTLHWEEYK